LATYFRHDLRVAPCDTCGGPLEAGALGGRVTCRYCAGQQDLTPREEAPLLVGPRLPEPERAALLRARDAFAQPIPAALRDLVLGDRLVPWLVPVALARWQMARRSLAGGRDPAAAEELFALTRALGQHYERQGAWLEARALAEGALDELDDPRKRQVLRANLARAAALTGDLGAAEAWLAGCDAVAADLDADGAYRLARACIETARGNSAAVLETLGRDVTDVALPNELDPLAALLRANAWERLGYADRASELLVHLAEYGGPVFHLQAREIADRHPELRLANAAYARAEPRLLALWEARASFVGTRVAGCFLVVGIGVVLGTLAALAVVTAGTLGFAELAGWSIGELVFTAGAGTLFGLSLVSMLGAVFALVGFDDLRKARSDRWLRAHGRLVPGVVVQRMATGNETVGVPEIALRVLVLDGDLAYLASTDTYLREPDSRAFARGAPVALRIDASDPHRFALVA